MTTENQGQQPVPRTPPQRVPNPANEEFEIPERSERRKPSGGRSMNEGLGKYIVIAVVAAVVCLAMNYFGIVGVKPTELNNTLGAISKDIQTSKTNDTTIQASITTLTNQISGMQSTNSANAQSVTAQNSKIDTAVNQVNSLNSQLANANANISKLQSDIAAIKTTPSVSPDVQKQIDSDKATIIKLQSQIEDINKKIAANPNPVTTPNPSTGLTGSTTTNTGTSHTLQGVTATLANLYGGFNGMPLMTFSVPTPSGGSINTLSLMTGGSGYFGYTTNVTGMPVNVVQGMNNNASVMISTTNGVINSFSGLMPYGSSGTGYTTNVASLVGGNGSGATVQVVANPLVAGTTQQTVTLQVTNSNTVATNNVQLALGLALVDSNGNPITTLPSWMTAGQNIAVTSGGFGTSWTFQSMQSPNIWVFSNVATSNPFGLGAINLAPGQTQTFTQYIQVTNNSNQGYGTIYLYPIIRVLSFTP